MKLIGLQNVESNWKIIVDNVCCFGRGRGENPRFWLRDPYDMISLASLFMHLWRWRWNQWMLAQTASSYETKKFKWKPNPLFPWPKLSLSSAGGVGPHRGICVLRLSSFASVSCFKPMKGNSVTTAEIPTEPAFTHSGMVRGSPLLWMEISSSSS